ncbi:uncharacterized protein [Oryctolagus cuniculus]|uniref:uncharacterized protein n=1 Tax=Oryctolagus cuniculus TaxID=9986 RepID=UPI0038791C3C
MTIVASEEGLGAMVLEFEAGVLQLHGSFQGGYERLKWRMYKQHGVRALPLQKQHRGVRRLPEDSDWLRLLLRHADSAAVPTVPSAGTLLATPGNLAGLQKCSADRRRQAVSGSDLLSAVCLRFRTRQGGCRDTLGAGGCSGQERGARRRLCRREAPEASRARWPPPSSPGDAGHLELKTATWSWARMDTQIMTPPEDGRAPWITSKVLYKLPQIGETIWHVSFSDWLISHHDIHVTSSRGVLTSQSSYSSGQERSARRQLCRREAPEASRAWWPPPSSPGDAGHLELKTATWSWARMDTPNHDTTGRWEGTLGELVNSLPGDGC